MDVPITALAWGVFVAGLAQLLFQLPYLARIGMLSRPRWAWRDEGVQRVIKLMLPAIFGSSVAQINLLFDTLIASFLVTGSVSWLYYSDRLVEFPLGVFGIALATVILPSLSRKHAEASTDEFARTLDWALRWVLLVGTPATVGLMLLAAPMLATLFQYGEFSAVDVEMAALSLVAYSFGLLGFILVKVLAPGFYARQDTRTPVRIGVIAMLSNMALNLVFVVPMVLMDLPGPHAGLAAATSLAAFINAGLLFKTLRKQGVYQAQPGWRKLLWQVGFANVVMAAALWWGRGDLAQWLLWSGLERAGQLTLWIVVGAAGYFVALLVAGVRPAQIKALMSQR
jgi:putative peptidoglycan lipid II flippase